MFDSATVKKMADLARLDIPDEKAQKFASELNAIVSYIETLQAVDTTNVTPMVQPHHFDTPLRDDVVHAMSDTASNTAGNTAMMLKPAPQVAADHFKVPQVL